MVSRPLAVPLLFGCLFPWLVFQFGCGSPPPPQPEPEPLAELASQFDPVRCGTITGQVLWEGALPHILPFKGPLSPRCETPQVTKYTWPNPHAPVISPQQQVGSAVVYLRGIDPRSSRPWDHSPVQIEFRDYQIHIRQGELESPYGFVRRGTAIEMVSRQKFFHCLQARGAAFFMTPFADPEVSQQRRLGRNGVVELSSGCGCFWMGGHLFVDDHPYYTRTDSEGRFTLTQVPAGQYQLVCFLPCWQEAGRELDGDSWEIASIQYASPLVLEREIVVNSGKTQTCVFTHHMPPQ